MSQRISYATRGAGSVQTVPAATRSCLKPEHGLRCGLPVPSWTNQPFGGVVVKLLEVTVAVFSTCLPFCEPSSAQPPFASLLRRQKEQLCGLLQQHSNSMVSKQSMAALLLLAGLMAGSLCSGCP